MSHTILKIDEQILQIDRLIYKIIETLGPSERGFVSQNILAQLRNLVEHVMLKVWKSPNDVENSYENICKAIEHTKSRGDLKFLRRFHDYLQIVASHYTLDEENSERLMLKYYEFLLKIKLFLRQRHGLGILQNIDNFPINTDPGIRQYHERIAERIDRHKAQASGHLNSERFYIRRAKPFFVKNRIYYEITFTPVNANASKFDRIIAFTSLDVAGFYAAKLHVTEDRVVVAGKSLPIFIITGWKVSIRPCEIDNFSRIFGIQTRAAASNAAYRKLMSYLTESGLHLVEVIDLPEHDYQGLKQCFRETEADIAFFDVLDRCRSLCQNNQAGRNIVRYLLLRLNNKIIKQQLERGSGNRNLSGLNLKNGCIPFDTMPFNTSPIDHNPKISDLFESIPAGGRKHELFARFIRNNTEIRAHIYTPLKDVDGFHEAEALIKTYNSTLWSGHVGRRILEFHNHLYISEYEEKTLSALRQLKKLSESGIKNHQASVDYWINTNIHIIDCEEKKNAIREMFTCSKVALIYGPAGTGKSTLINHTSHLFSNYAKIYLANTNPAIDNLRRKVNAPNCQFYTIAKFLKNQSVNRNCDILIIDECSTVSNQDIDSILTTASFKLLVLVGDIYQIESIRFGNWFSAARSFIPQTSVFELTKPYRSQNKGLLELWKKVRDCEDTTVEHIAKNDYSRNLDSSIFEHTRGEEIILCLNYDGLYGINNINRLLQESNPNTAITWGIHNYKVGDPILFNESNRFSPLIYNNMKGRIAQQQVLHETNEIQFDIELERAISGMDADGYDFTLLGNSARGNSIIRFNVSRYKSTDDDDDGSASDVVPFQVAYAVSIHKAQGLEYDSVKIVITDETDELITHNIFYTAITRAKETLKIYWSPEVEKRVLERFKSKKSNKDVALLKLRDPALST